MAIKSIVIFIGIYCCCLLLISGCTGGKSDTAEKKQLYYERGMKQLELGEPSAAVIELKNAIKIDPKFVEARYKLALIYLDMSDLKNAINQLVRVVDLDPANFDARLKLAELLFLAGREQESRILAEKILEENSQYVDALALLAKIKLSAGDAPGAEQLLQNILGQKVESPRIYSILAEVKSAVNDTAAEEDALKKAIALAPENLIYHMNLVNYYVKYRQADKAIGYLKELSEKFPKSNEIIIKLITVYEGFGKVDAAEAAMQKLIQMDPENYTSYLLIGDFCRRRKKVVEAENYFAKALEKAKDNNSVHEVKALLASFYLEQKKNDLAAAKIDEILVENPKHKSASFLKARMLMDQRKFRSAVVILDELKAQFPDWGEVHYMEALAHVELSELDLALQSVESAAKSMKNDERPQALLAHVMLLQGRYLDAEREAAAALQRNPANYAAALTLGKILMAQKNFEAALRHFTQMSEYFPARGEVKFNLALTLLAMGKTTQAAGMFEEALAEMPEHTPSLSYLAKIYAETKGVEEAIARVRSQIQASPDNFGHLILLGRLLIEEKKFEEALTVYKDAETLAPNSLQANLGIADAMVRLGREEELVAEYRAILAKDPQQVVTSLKLGTLLEKRGELDRSREVYAEALKYQPKFAPAANNLALLILQEGNPDLGEALRLATMAKEQASDDPYIADTLGYVYYKRGAYELADMHLSQAVTLLPQQSAVRYHYALNLAALGKKEEAGKELDSLLASKSEFVERRQAEKIRLELAK